MSTISSTALLMPDTLPILDGSVIIDRDFLLDAAYLGPDDVAFVGGSLVEGLGNRFSDVDVHVITPRLLTGKQVDPSRHFRVLSTEREILKGGESADVFLIHTVLPGTDIKVDVEYRTSAEIDALAASVRSIFDYACSSLVLLSKSLDHREMAFLHRMFNSYAFQDVEGLARIRNAVGIERYTYLLYRWKASDFSVLIDILGAMDKAETDRAFDMARENLITQFHAYTNLLGSTNFNRKWLTATIDSAGVPSDLAADFLRLFRVDGVGSEHERRSYVLETLDFVDRVFAASAIILEDHLLTPPCGEALSALDGLLDEDASTYSRLEVEYRARAYGRSLRPTRALSDWSKS